MVNGNLQQVVGRWSESAEMSVFLQGRRHDGAAAGDRRGRLRRAAWRAERSTCRRQTPSRGFARIFPISRGAADRLDAQPVSGVDRSPADARGAQAAAATVDGLATRLGAMPGVADVRYDRRWLSRLGSAVQFLRDDRPRDRRRCSAIAAALTVANVVRLAAYARRDEIEIMQLVGAPFAFIRGPFVAEGILQGGFGALVAIASLWAVFMVGKAWYGRMALEGLGLSTLVFLPAGAVLRLLAGGMLLGCVGGLIVARTVR